jgi:hypothetical protein
LEPFVTKPRLPGASDAVTMRRRQCDPTDSCEIDDDDRRW